MYQRECYYDTQGFVVCSNKKVKEDFRGRPPPPPSANPSITSTILTSTTGITLVSQPCTPSDFKNPCPSGSYIRNCINCRYEKSGNDFVLKNCSCKQTDTTLTSINKQIVNYTPISEFNTSRNVSDTRDTGCQPNTIQFSYRADANRVNQGYLSCSRWRK